MLGLPRVVRRDLPDPHDHLDDLGDVDVRAHDAGLLGALQQRLAGLEGEARQTWKSAASWSR